MWANLLTTLIKQSLAIYFGGCSPTVLLIFPIQWSTEESMQHYAEIVSLVCRSAAIQPVQAYWTESTSPALLEPLINKVELFYFGPEFIITVEGANLHFCNKLSVGDTEVRNVCSLSGSAFQIDVGDKSNSWQWLQQESVMLYNSFSGRNTIDFLTKVSDVSLDSKCIVNTVVAN